MNECHVMKDSALKKQSITKFCIKNLIFQSIFDHPELRFCIAKPIILIIFFEHQTLRIKASQLYIQ